MNGTELRRFSEAVLALQKCGTAAELGEALLHGIQTLLRADQHTVNWIGPAQFKDIWNRTGDFPREVSLDVFNAHLGEHPLLPIIEGVWNDYSPRASRWSDHTTLREFRQKALYADFFRYFGSRAQAAVTLRVTNDSALGFAFERARGDFRPEDLELLKLFIPHAAQVARAMLGQAELEGALALREMVTASDAAMVVGRDGTILFATEGARRLAREYFPLVTPDGLPLELRDWLWGGTPDTAPLRRERSGARLTCTRGLPVPWRSAKCVLMDGENEPGAVRCLRFQEQREADDLLALQTLGLTKREAEVLYWMAQGKRNSEIAIVLGATPRTVDKHAEHIFAKLAAETRASAVAMACEAMNVARPPI